MVASSMGQQATKAEILSTELVVKDISQLMAQVGMLANEWEQLPAMHPQYNVKATSAAAADKLAGLMAKLQVNGADIGIRRKEDGFFSMDFGHVNLGPEAITFDGNTVTAAAFGLENQKVDEEAAGTAYHIPEGMMFVYDPQNIPTHQERATAVDTRSIAPSILESFGLPVPAYMVKDRVEALT